jgi:hypothetical protein
MAAGVAAAGERVIGGLVVIRAAGLSAFVGAIKAAGARAEPNSAPPAPSMDRSVRQRPVPEQTVPTSRGNSNRDWGRG